MNSIITHTLSNKNGMSATVTNLGCAIISLKVPDKNGTITDVVLGLDRAEDYATRNGPFFGVVAGRVANRIAGGTFTLNGKTYTLEKNNGNNHLHGGKNGFDKKVWNVEEATPGKIIFTYNSPCGESGYPGNLYARVTYTLTDDNALRIDYSASTDTITICNLTNHSYFNLSGHNADNICDHVLEIAADKITAIDAELIPTGEFMCVANTPFDFRTPKPIGKDIAAAGGYDHNYVLRSPDCDKGAACVYSPRTGIRMTVYTNSPGMQFYTGNFLAGKITGKGVAYQKHSGFCMETQIFPDAVNKPHFPSCVVDSANPQQFYTEFKFS